MIKQIFRTALFLLGFTGLGFSQTMQHHHPAQVNVPEEILDHLGQVNFPISCSVEAQPSFNRGVALLHSFWYEEARNSFNSVVAKDPNCAMAFWGLAMSEWRPFWDGLPEDRRSKALLDVNQAETLHPETPREQQFVDGLRDFLVSAQADPQKSTLKYAQVLGEMHISYPNDVEIQAFYGLALSVEASFEKDPTPNEKKALSVLIPGFEAHPDHPGFAHYIIHACDSPQLAREALPAAEHYSRIAPDSPHALHMPSHIYARLGMWNQDIAANQASVDASENAARNHLDGGAHEMHAYEFMLYAYLQIADDMNAKRIYDYTTTMVSHLSQMPDIQSDGMFTFISFPQVEFPAIYHLERHEWHAVLDIPLPPQPLPFTQFYRDWARAVAAGHLRDATIADVSADDAHRLYEEVEKEGLPNGGDLHASMLTIEAWQLYAHHKDVEAVAKMGQAADSQDRVGQAEVDIPAREMYANMLEMTGKTAEALTQYERALLASPARLNGLAGAARTASETGRKNEALRLDQAIVQMARSGRGSVRPEVIAAKAELRRRGGVATS